jgi:hypothetical protein
MIGNGKGPYKDLRVLDLEDETHQRIERWKDLYNGRTGEGITKSDAAKKLLHKATKHIKLPVAV